MLIEIGVSFMSADLKGQCFQGFPAVRWAFVIKKAEGENYYFCDMTKLVKYQRIQLHQCSCTGSCFSPSG